MSSSLTGQTFQVNNTTLTIQERIYHVPTQELWESKIMSVKGWQRRRSVYNCQKPGSDEKFVLKVDKLCVFWCPLHPLPHGVFSFSGIDVYINTP
jgi:hypothetical protein